MRHVCHPEHKPGCYELLVRRFQLSATVSRQTGGVEIDCTETMASELVLVAVHM